VSAGRSRLRSYVSGLATYVVRLGADLTATPGLHEDEAGHVSFEIVADLPGSGQPTPARIVLRELWVLSSQRWEAAEYEYELLDHQRDRRRAFHRHHEAFFLRRAGVTVHEHCEETLGAPRCNHYFGLPLRDGYEGVEQLVIAWTENGPLGCAGLRCMDERLR